MFENIKRKPEPENIYLGNERISNFFWPWIGETIILEIKGGNKYPPLRNYILQYNYWLHKDRLICNFRWHLHNLFEQKSQMFK